MSGKSANVFYELGVRHALFRYGTVPIIRHGETLPFDIANYRAIFYSTEGDGPEKFREELLRRIKAFDSDVKRKSDNPVHDIVGDKLFGLDPKGMVSRAEYETKVAEMDRLRRDIDNKTVEISGLERQISDYFESGNFTVRKERPKPDPNIREPRW